MHEPFSTKTEIFGALNSRAPHASELLTQAKELLVGLYFYEMDA